MNKWRFDSEFIPWLWIGLIHAANGNGKQCALIFNQTKYSVAYSPEYSIQREQEPHLTGHQKVTSSGVTGIEKQQGPQKLGWGYHKRRAPKLR